MMTTGGVPANEVETHVSMRVGRRDALQRKNPARFDGYIGETALRQIIGGAEVMREQLEYLVTLAELPPRRSDALRLESGVGGSVRGRGVRAGDAVGTSGKPTLRSVLA